jgi:hypothetical protein
MMQEIVVAATFVASVGQAVLAGFFVSKKKYGWAASTAILSIISMMIFCTTLIQGAIAYAA